jgi:hypothetical protein
MLFGYFHKKNGGVLWYPQMNNNPLFSFIQWSIKFNTGVKNMTSTTHTCSHFATAPEMGLVWAWPIRRFLAQLLDVYLYGRWYLRGLRWCLGWAWYINFGLFCCRRRVCLHLWKVETGKSICGQCDSPCHRGWSRGSWPPPSRLPTTLWDGEEGPCCSVFLGVSLLVWCGSVLHSLFGLPASSARLLWWVRGMVVGEILARFTGADFIFFCPYLMPCHLYSHFTKT